MGIASINPATGETLKTFSALPADEIEQKLQLAADRSIIKATGNDLAFITVQITDSHGIPAPEAGNEITFEIAGPGEIVATDNGNAADLVAFPSKKRNAFNGLALVIVRAKAGKPGAISVTAKSNGLTAAQIVIRSNMQ